MKGISLDFGNKEDPKDKPKVGVVRANKPKFGQIFEEWIDTYWSGDFDRKIDAVYKISEIFRDCLEDPDNEEGIFGIEIEVLAKIKAIFEDFYAQDGSVLAA